MADRPLIRVVAKGRIEPPARGAVRRPTVPVILRRDERISDRSMAYHPSCLPAAAGLPCTSPDDGAQYTLASGFRAGLIEAAARERAMSPDTSALVGAVIGAGAMSAGSLVPSSRELRCGVADLRERMARPEGLFKGFTRRESAPPA